MRLSSVDNYGGKSTMWIDPMISVNSIKFNYACAILNDIFSRIAAAVGEY